MYWGLSPALDLQEEYLSVHADDKDEINILIIGGCDSRHILKTIAKSYKHKEKQINIHVIEGCSELVARQLLLLYIATISSSELGLQEKTRMFMELYGNTLLRYPTSRYMIKASKVLIKFITNLSLMEKHWPLISLDKIKYRERDYIEMLLKFWNKGNSNKFDICFLWERRLRNYLGVRYDCRVGVFDWDYNMRLRDVGGRAVNLQEYKHFRSTGVAFTWLETEVSRPNYTFAGGVLTNGENFTHRGYLGDIVTGPFIAYGLDCEDEDMLKVSNGTYHKRSSDLTERNLLRFLYELEYRKPFDKELVKGDADHDLGMVTVAMLDANISEEQNGDNKLPDSIPNFIRFDQIKISFHSFSTLDFYPSNENFMKKFDVMFVSNNISKIIKPSIMKCIRDDGLVIIEGKKFILDMKKDDVKLFAKDLENIAKDWSCEFQKKFEPFEDSCAKLVPKSSNNF